MEQHLPSEPPRLATLWTPVATTRTVSATDRASLEILKVHATVEMYVSA